MKKSFRLFKQLDVVFQIALLSLTAVYLLYCHYFQNNTELLFYAYFLIGGVQLISFFINFFSKGLNQSFLRKIYTWIILVLLALLIPPITFIGLYAALLLSPFIAVFYAYLNYAEYRKQQFFY